MNAELVEKVKKDIDWEIGNCKSSGIYPNICSFIQTDAGYNRLQEMVLGMVANEGMRIDSALAQLENTI